MLGYVAKLVAVGLNTVVMAPAVVASAAFDARLAYHLSQLWAQTNLVIGGVRVRVTRRAPLDPRSAYVFMSNHASHFDVVAVVAALSEFQLRWVAKRELAMIPVFGWALRNAGHIIIDRSNPEQAIATLRAAKAQMDTGVSVMIFPEGTRERHDHELLPLKRGGFVLAAETGAPIVPIAVRGSRAILSRNDWRIHAGEIDVVVGEPIPVVGVDRKALVERVRAVFVHELGFDTAAPAIAEGAR